MEDPTLSCGQEVKAGNAPKKSQAPTPLTILPRPACLLPLPTLGCRLSPHPQPGSAPSTHKASLTEQGPASHGGPLWEPSNTRTPSNTVLEHKPGLKLQA